MKAYIIVDVNITDPARYGDYKKLTPGSLVPFEGKFIVRGGTTETLEGDWKPGPYCGSGVHPWRKPKPGGHPTRTHQPKPSVNQRQ